MPEFVTIRRWSLKDGASEQTLIEHVRDGLIPAYQEQPGCLQLELLRMSEPRSYLAITHWDARSSYEAWAGAPGESWRGKHRAQIERWLELMSFQAEWDAEEVAST